MLIGKSVDISLNYTNAVKPLMASVAIRFLFRKLDLKKKKTFLIEFQKHALISTFFDLNLKILYKKIVFLKIQLPETKFFYFFSVYFKYNLRQIFCLKNLLCITF
jgi:hypothetical protein